MTNIKLYTICLIFSLYAVSCQKETEAPKVEKLPCVGPEDNQDTISGFLIFEKGEQEFGFAKGIKINQPYESSVALKFINDSLFGITLVSYWPEYKGHFPVAEILNFSRIPVEYLSDCYYLTNNRLSVDSIKTSYGIVNDDVGILLYELDESAENVIEFISFDKFTKKLKARVKASYIGEKEYPPDLPKKVRFIDTYIEYGYKE